MNDATILQCEAELRRAMLTGDVPALERLIDEALVFTTQTGALVTKQADLDAHRAGVLRLSTLAPSEERVQRYGDTAVVTVRMEVAGTYAGAPFAGTFRYTRVWLKRPEGWRVVAGHVSQVLL